MSEPLILGIETSCDDTGAAVVRGNKLLANVVNSQDVHVAWGGVVPELASRAHQQQIVPMVDLALQKAGVSFADIEGIAVTAGPGLMGSLLVGVQFAKGLSLSLGIPCMGVHHLEAHVLVHFLEEKHPPFPYLCLLVSGGHTQIVQVDAADKLMVLGKTWDDAVGEAFDKSAKMLGLPYPGGPFIDKYAQEGKPVFRFSKAQIPGLDFSFSGFKTSVRYFLEEQIQKKPEFISENLQNLCASVQQNLIETLLQKLQMASKQTGIRHIALAGGVAANQGLRHLIKEIALKENWHVYIPRLPFCTDNAAMIAMAGVFKFEKGIWLPDDFVPFPSGNNH